MPDAPRILLASASPRRKELLELAGVKFRICVPDIDETPVPRETPRAMVRRLSRGKALEAWKIGLSSRGSALIVSADTTVVSPRGAILGKPRNPAEACRMIRELQGRVHEVFTGYSVVEVRGGRLFRSLTRAVRTRVRIRAMGPGEIESYVARGESLDKAGAYAAQGFGMAIIESISGSYTNVVGLPVTELLRDLRSFGWKR